MAPIEPKYHHLMNELAPALDSMFNGKTRGKERKVGFFLSVFEFDAVEGGRFNYISNADRGDIVVLLKEMTAKFEGQPDVAGRA